MLEQKMNNSRHFAPVISPTKMLITGLVFNKAPLHDRRNSETKVYLLSPREVVNNARHESFSMMEKRYDYHPKMLKS